VSKTAVKTAQPVAKPKAPKAGIMQRKCDCGSHTVAGGECESCAKGKADPRKRKDDRGGHGLQTKLEVGSWNDPLEYEADRIADRVLSAPAYRSDSSAPLNIQRLARQHDEVGTAPASVDRVLSSPGKPLERALLQNMGRRFGYDFSRVRVHSGADAAESARDVHAQAYTVGQNIVFGAGRFSPGTDEGRRLIAHELTHVVQQSGANPGVDGGEAFTGDEARTPAVPDNGGRPMEAPLRRFMESRLGHDFSGVRLHTGRQAEESAKSVNALAYTAGQNVVFGAGGYAPDTPRGLHLLAHELGHVVQQSRNPPPMGTRPRVESQASMAEIEADRTATSVLTPGPVPERPSARSTGLNRSSGWAVLGGVIGAIVGGLLGALAGPAGAVIGALVGGAIGTGIGAAGSNSKTDDKKGSARARIHRLLTTSFTDWTVTEAEAQQALGILQEVDKRDPEELFFNVMVMKMNGEWDTLRKKLPPSMRLGMVYFEQVACNPDHGYVMPGDRLHLEFHEPGARQPAAEGNDSAKGDKDAGTSYVAFLSHDYNVDTTGLNFPNMPPVPVVGKTLKQAADQIAEAYVDPLKDMYSALSVDLTPVTRGSKYAGMGQVTSPETVHGGAVTTDTVALARREKRKKFAELVPRSVGTVGSSLEMAVILYYKEVDNNLDKYEDPEALWKWAKEEGQKRWDEFNKKTPAQEFLEFAQHIMAENSKQPPTERARNEETYSRYMAWLSKHSQDPKLASYKPVQIWTQAYINIFKEEVQVTVKKEMEARKEQKRDEEWKKAEVKFGEVLDFARTKIWPATPDKGVSAGGEQISETSGEVVKVGYLITASPAEKIIRDKIASDFMHSVLERMRTDPEAFNRTSVIADFDDYLKNNPEQLKALQLTTSHPTVERQEDKVDIPAWQTATEVIVGLIPFVGTAVGVAEVASGQDLFGHPLSTTERTVIGIGLLLPGIFKVLKLGKEAFVASKIVKAYGLEGAEAARVYRIYTGLGPGTMGAKLFGWGVNEIKAGRALDDPKVLQEMETVLKDLGMTDKETAKALLPAVERQAETVAKEEIKAVEAVVGPISEDTETMLMKNEALREALKENSLAATVLKKCNTPCFPEQATAKQVQRLEEILGQIKKTGAYNEDALRTFLYDRRAQLDKAISEINTYAGSKSINSGSASKDLNAWLDFRNSGGKITQGVDPALIQAQKNLAHDIGVEAGRKQVGLDGLVLSDFDTPFKSGSHGQGFDDIAIQGKNWDKDVIYIIEHKGGEADLAPGQMETDWVVGNIQRLYREGGAEGKMWAQRLAKAMEEGRLRGRAYSTPVVSGAAGGTSTIKSWAYKGPVKLAP
jgi:hypothetical protein